jgi:hypothetical protein
VNTIITGLLFAQSAMQSPWFTLLASFVAFNTMIYVSLTVAKIIPWPKPFWAKARAPILTEVPGG